MAIDCDLSLSEKLILIQKQLRIAIKNHHLMVQRKQLLKNRDEKIKHHIEALQYIIINIGKTQATLLSEYRKAIASKHNLDIGDPAILKLMKKALQFPDPPKHVPIFKENAKKLFSKQKMKSVLKVKERSDSDTNKILPKFSETTIERTRFKIIYNKKREANSIVVQQAKRLQSVLKPKNVQLRKDEEGTKGKTFEGKKEEEFQAKKEKMGDESQTTILNTTTTKVKGKMSPPDSPPGVEQSESPPPLIKMDTRYGRKYQAKLLSPAKFKPPSAPQQVPSVKRVSGDTGCKGDEEWMPFPSCSSSIKSSKDKYKSRPLEEIPLSIDELSQESFLGMFRLVSKSKSEILKKKKSERKRRSAAGQNSQYSDYLQPTPKRVYQSRKSLPPTIPSVVPQNTNAVIVESSAGDDDDEEDKEKSICFVCHEPDGSLEACYGCNVSFHFNCLPANQKEICPSPSCMAQRTISNIVGANVSSGNASDVELVKRYLSDELNSDKGSDEKQTRASNNDISLSKHEVLV